MYAILNPSFMTLFIISGLSILAGWLSMILYIHSRRKPIYDDKIRHDAIIEWVKQNIDIFYIDRTGTTIVMLHGETITEVKVTCNCASMHKRR